MAKESKKQEKKEDLEVLEFCRLNGIEVSTLTPELKEQILAIKRSVKKLIEENKITLSPQRKTEITSIAVHQIERVISMLTGMTGLAASGMDPLEVRKIVREIVFEAIESVIEKT